MAKKIPFKTFAFGGCAVSSIGPDVSTLSPETPILNVSISFEDALKLSLAIQECVRKLNSYNRSTSAGKRTGLNLAIHLQKSRITINETAL
jgi:hypothetical protein